MGGKPIGLWLLAGAFVGGIVLHDAWLRHSLYASPPSPPPYPAMSVTEVAMLAVPLLVIGWLARGEPVRTWRPGRLCALWGWLLCAHRALDSVWATRHLAGALASRAWGDLYFEMRVNFYIALAQLLVLPALGIVLGWRWFGGRALREWGAGGLAAFLLGCAWLAFVWVSCELHFTFGSVGREEWLDVFSPIQHAMPTMLGGVAIIAVLAWTFARVRPTA